MTDEFKVSNLRRVVQVNMTDWRAILRFASAVIHTRVRLNSYHSNLIVLVERVFDFSALSRILISRRDPIFDIIFREKLADANVLYFVSLGIVAFSYRQEFLLHTLLFSGLVALLIWRK